MAILTRTLFKKDFVMKISNVIYLSQPFNPHIMVSTSLAKSEDTAYEHLNEPTLGYIPVEHDTKLVYLKHPTLDFLAAIDVLKFVDIAIKGSCSEALLIFNDEGFLEEYDPSSMTIEVRHDPEMYEHRWVNKIDKPLPLEQGLRYFVQNINYTTKKATVLELYHGKVNRESVALDDLVSEWEISPALVNHQLINTLANCIHANTKFKIRQASSPHGFTFSKENGIQYHTGISIPGVGPVMQDAETSSLPVLMCSGYYRPNDVLIEVSDGTPANDYRRELIVHSSLLAKHWAKLPIVGHKFWRDSIQLRAKDAFKDEFSSYKVNGCDALPRVIGSALAFCAFVNIANQVFQVSFHLSSHVSPEGVPGILKHISVSKEYGIEYSLQRAVLGYINTFLGTTDHIISQTEIQENCDQMRMSMKSFVPCELTVDNVEAIRQAFFEKVNGAISLELQQLSVPFYKRGAREANSLIIPTIVFSAPQSYHAEEIKRKLLKTPN